MKLVLSGSGTLGPVVAHSRECDLLQSSEGMVAGESGTGLGMCAGMGAGPLHMSERFPKLRPTLGWRERWRATRVLPESLGSPSLEGPKPRPA